jgi:energy-coupling factor transporter ATP-binding protein EcfA2
MHLDPIHALYQGRSLLKISLPSRVCVVIFGLAFILLVNQWHAALIIALGATILNIVERTGTLRIVLPWMVTANFALMNVVLAWFGLTNGALWTPFLKSVSATALLSWFGGTVSWSYLKRRYFDSSPFSWIATWIDEGLLHGQLLLNHIEQRFEVAFIRIGRAFMRPENVALAVAGGVVNAFQKSVRLDDLRMLRESRHRDEVSIHSAPDPGAMIEKATECVRDLPPEVLQVQHLFVKAPTGEQLLHDIHFSMRQGECLFLGGASGSGKTTLLRAICGLSRVNSGSICVEKKDVVRYRRPLGSIGLVPQNPDDSFFGSTPREDIIWGLTHKGYGHQEACFKAEQILADFGMSHLIDRAISNLSFGEKKRVSLAAALVVESKLLLLDEPTSGLDLVAGRKLIDLVMQQVGLRGTTVIWVSHDIHMLPPHLNAVLLLKDGYQVTLGCPDQALHEANLRSAGLLV